MRLSQKMYTEHVWFIYFQFLNMMTSRRDNMKDTVNSHNLFKIKKMQITSQFSWAATL
jgi:hypothetical protein